MSKNIVVNFRVTDDVKMKRLNQDTFGKNESTDVIAFPIDQEVAEGVDLAGEIVVNRNEILRNSKAYDVPFAQEMARVVTHGVLHLLGFEDKSKQGRAAMRQIEDMVVEEIDHAE